MHTYCHLPGLARRCALPIAEYGITADGVGGYIAAIDREFIWGARFPEPVAMIDHTDLGDAPAGVAEVLHYLHDALGSVIALTNTNGQVVERYDYDPYGTTYIEDAAGVPLALASVDPLAPLGYYHDSDVDGDIDAADYADLMACVDDKPYDPLCVYSHGERSERRGVADQGGRTNAEGCA